MSLARLRLIAVNTFIATMVVILAIDALPAPLGIKLAVRPVLTRLGIAQGSWSLFAPDPDRMNTRLRAEITYRDGERREWLAPDWRTQSIWQMFTGHRRREWLDHIISPDSDAAWEPWCRDLARTVRPDFPNADHGADVRVIYQEAPVPPAETRPWPSINSPPSYDSGWILTTETLK